MWILVRLLISLGTLMSRVSIFWSFARAFTRWTKLCLGMKLLTFGHERLMSPYRFAIGTLGWRRAKLWKKPCHFLQVIAGRLNLRRLKGIFHNVGRIVVFVLRVFPRAPLSACFQ